MADVTGTMFDSLLEQVQSYDRTFEAVQVGYVEEVGDGIARVSGLENVRFSELVAFANGSAGIVFNLEEKHVGVIIMGEYDKINEGDEVRALDRIASVPVGAGLVGRVVDALGNPLDGRGPVASDEYYPVERIAPGVMERRNVFRPVQTGIVAIDSMTPVGRGQRELIIGDRQIGKTALAIDTILNQKEEDMKCVYVAIGKRKGEIARLVALLEEAGAMEYTTVVVASARTRQPCNTFRPMPAAPSANGSWRTARTRWWSTMTSPSTPGPTVRSRC